MRKLIFTALIASGVMMLGACNKESHESEAYNSPMPETTTDPAQPSDATADTQATAPAEEQIGTPAPEPVQETVTAPSTKKKKAH